MISFEWDHSKNRLNSKKHGVTFKEAESIFADPNARIIADPEHSYAEDRFILLGLSDHLRILIVCHCYRKGDQAIRIISARKATKGEEKIYWEYLS